MQSFRAKFQGGGDNEPKSKRLNALEINQLIEKPK